MPTIVLKKVFKDKEYSVSNEKGLSFHGASVTRLLVDNVNHALGTLRISEGANRPIFRWHPTNGHYYASMNHSFQKKHEEDAVAEILDVMEAMGWNFKFQYDSAFSSQKIFGGESETSNELWIFNKEPECYEIFKESVDTTVGIVLAEDEHNLGKIVVKRLNAGSIFEATGVSPGAVVMSINNVPCKGKSVSEAIKLISTKQGVVKLTTY